MSANYVIKVERGLQKGSLKFKHGSVSVSSTCWWDKSNKIDSGNYTGSATWMANKAESDGQPCPWKSNKKYRPGIWFGKGVKSNKGTKINNGIFIHKGTSAAWSDGCIVCATSDVLKIWKAISTKDKAIVKVIVSDKVPTRYEIETLVKDPSVKAALRKALQGGGKLSYNEVCMIIRSTQDYGKTTRQEVADLQAILTNAKSLDLKSKQLIAQFVRNPRSVRL